VGVVGEIYIRSQRFSNGNLIKRLEEFGCEVAMPSIAEWFLYTNYTRIMNCGWFREHRREFFSRLFNIFMLWRQSYVYRLMGLEREPKVTELLKAADQYVHRSFEGETVLSIAKTLEYIESGLSGVVNVMPFTCMPGNIVTTIYKAIKDRHQDFPLLVLSYDGVANTLDAMRLETFVSQASAFNSRRPG
jgi:predicted nucleotide-binding protein (sugar kinase/HSP70/actin superfamily)